MSRRGPTVYGVLAVMLGVGPAVLASATVPRDQESHRRLLRSAARDLRTVTTEESKMLEALDLLRDRLAMRPDDPGLRGLRAWFYYVGREYDSAIADLWFVLRDAPELWGARIFLAMVYLEKGDVRSQHEQGTQRVWRLHELAIAELERVLAKMPDDQEATQLLAKAYNGQAYLLYLRRQDLDLALDLVNRAVTLHPAQTLYLSTKAEVLYALGRPAEALPHLQRALKDYPNEPDLLKDLEWIESSLSEKPR